MPIDPTIVNTAKIAVQDDIIDGFRGSLSPDPEHEMSFAIDLTDSGLMEGDIIATSDSVVVLPWAWQCVHTGTFLDIPATFVHFELRGATFVTVKGDNPEGWTYNRFIDFLCALHHIGVHTAVRPALMVPEFVEWRAANHP